MAMVSVQARVKKVKGNKEIKSPYIRSRFFILRAEKHQDKKTVGPCWRFCRGMLLLVSYGGAFPRLLVQEFQPFSPDKEQCVCVYNVMHFYLQMCGQILEKLALFSSYVKVGKRASTFMLKLCLRFGTVDLRKRCKNFVSGNGCGDSNGLCLSKLNCDNVDISYEA
ncbi:hypothetical protein VNO77_02915 [Canavalia gladiata]|uniref:Uncharacterized protein n=1 Tax=Canavalia gladiata TaxID=3824 RepID=A0AAN9MYT8_CANGL